MGVVSATPTRLAAEIDKGREELDLLLRELAERAGISVQTLLSIRDRETPPSSRQVKNERKLERALLWAPGSLQAIREGREPEPLAADSLEREIWASPHLDDHEKADMVAQYRKRKAERGNSL